MKGRKSDWEAFSDQWSILGKSEGKVDPSDTSSTLD